MRRPARTCVALALGILVTSVRSPGQVGPDQAHRVLEANRAAVNKASGETAALRLRYGYSGRGLHGTVSETSDLKRPAFLVTRRVGGLLEQEGFDGTVAWARERSGSVNAQSGGDMRELAINQAYRNTNGWWKADFGGAVVSYLGRRAEGSVAAEVLRVFPIGGVSFDAWFDASTHLLIRIDEPRHGQSVIVRLSDYRRVAGTMVPGRVRVGTDDPGDDEVQTLASAEALRIVPSDCCAAPGWSPRDTEMFNGADRVTVPFRIVNRHIYADVTVNGKGPFPFMFDTGGVNILTPATARAAGVGSAGSLAMRGAGAGAVVGGIATVHSLAIGGVHFTEQPVRVLPMSDSDIEQAGMIGFEAFRRWVTKIDYGRGTIEFIRPSAFDASAAGTAVPIAFYGNLPVAEGSYDGVPGSFTIDTGNPGGLFLSSPFARSHDIASRIKRGVRTIAGVGVGGPSYGVVFRGGALRLGTVTVGRPVTLVSTDAAGAMADPSLAGNVGAEILRRFVVTLDYARSVIYLKPIDPAPPNLDRYDRSGTRITRTPGRTEVTEVVEGGPAASAGLKSGDTIVSIDGRSASEMSLDAIRSLLRDRPEGTHVTLQLRREGAPISVVLTLRELIGN